MQDLPRNDAAVAVELVVPKWWCDNPDCPQRIFCMRLTPWVPAYGRRSTRLTEWLADWAWTTSAEEVAATAARHGVPLSSATVVRILRAQPDPVYPSPRVVGIDDGAIAKGHDYATVVVDFERHRVLDILPDRTAETVAAWLREHPSVEIVSRDRAIGYANAAYEGAPQAGQVADRWHLLKNLGENIERLLRRVSPFAKGPSPDGDAEVVPSPVPSEEEQPAPDTPALTPRQIIYAAVHRLAAAGWNMSQIARELSCDRKTVRHDLLAPPPHAHPQRDPYPHLLDPFEPLLQRLWENGQHRRAVLWEALKNAGFTGGRSTLGRWMARHRLGTPSRKQARPTTHKLAHWFLARWLYLPRSAVSSLTQVLKHPVPRHAYTLVHPFRTMIMHHQDRALSAWLHAAETSGIPERVRFAEGIREDEAAVRAGIRGP
ncbi:MAG: hypothetical protein C7B44_13760 [Sulfobacillus thermosulfidooxidans]|nr:MAG: hypothetical protein C7B44_13760 [Sulfobacillus thermosulfidooxidans]